MAVKDGKTGGLIRPRKAPHLDIRHSATSETTNAPASPMKAHWSIPATPLYFDQIFLHNSANHPQGVAPWPKT
jgi:hypothetical protein